MTMMTTTTNGAPMPTNGTGDPRPGEVGRDNPHMARAHPTPAAARQHLRGFTLIELMIGVVVAALLATLAFPAFFDAVRKGRRSDAFAALVSVQQAQERWRAGNPTYTVDLGALGLRAASSGGHYTVSVTAADATSYVLQALATGSQAQDKPCATLILSAAGGSVVYGSACSTCTVPAPLTDAGRCWSRQ